MVYNKKTASFGDIFDTKMMTKANEEVKAKYFDSMLLRGFNLTKENYE